MLNIIQPELLSFNNFSGLTDYNRSFNIISMKEHIGDRIKTARKLAKISQVDLAEKSGVKQQMISKLESKKAETTSSIVALATALGVTPEWLQFGTGEMGRGDNSSQRVNISALLDVATPTYMETLQTLQKAQDNGVLEEADKAMLKIIADKYKDRLCATQN